MGRAKAWLPWFGGRTLVEHVVERLRPAVDEVVVVTSADLDLPPLEARVVRDREPERGPLAGLRDGLAAVESDFAFVTATDAPFLTPAYVGAMLDRGVACAPVADGHVQVLSAVVPRAGAALAERLLTAGRARPLALLEALDFVAIDEGELDVGETPPWLGFNTPEAYLDAVRAEDPGAQCEVELLGRAATDGVPPVVTSPVGSLGDVLAHVTTGRDLTLVEEDRIARAHLVSLGGRDLVRARGLPVGPGERVTVLDAQAGG
jgi:molybdopterin-guanine dinucleotide biosynthesis protein A